MADIDKMGLGMLCLNICFDDINHQNLTNVILNRKMIDNNLIGIWGN